MTRTTYYSTPRRGPRVCGLAVNDVFDDESPGHPIRSSDTRRQEAVGRPSAEQIRSVADQQRVMARGVPVIVK